MDKLIIPNKLNAGDTVAVVSSSWCGPGAISIRYEAGKEKLESIFNLNVIEMPHAKADPNYVYEHPEERAKDLMMAFANPEIKGIISSIGGSDSCRMIKHIDFDLIKKNPKILMGFSDTTVSHFICLKAGIRSYYGPSVMAVFAENVQMHQYSINGVKKNLFSNEVIGEIPENNEGWTNVFLEWGDPKNKNIKRELNPPTERKFLGSDKAVQGRLIGGCVEVLNFLNGSEIWPSLETWKDSILFLETSEEGVAPEYLTYFLRCMALQGILKNINGILFSKPGGEKIKAEDFPKYDEAILKVLNEEKLNIPLVTNMDFGHSGPMWIMPYGALTEINSKDKTVSILESGVK